MTQVNELSEEYIKQNCPHCDPTAEAFKYLLKQTDNFSIVCDAHPISKGHVLIIPKKHLSCIGEYPKNLYQEFLELYQQISDFLFSTYGSVSSFEHGKFGQTVFHSHAHFIPFKGKSTDIVPEGANNLSEITDLAQLRKEFKNKGGYLFLSMGDNNWIVDIKLAAPRFFRDRFAIAFKKPYRGNWKVMHTKENGHTKAEREAQDTQKLWKQYNKKS